MSGTTAETLRRAKALIDQPQKWGRNEAACPECGHRVLPAEDKRLTAREAIEAAAGSGWDAQYALSRVEGIIDRGRSIVQGSINLATFNADSSHAEVMALLDAAIEAEESWKGRV